MIKHLLLMLLLCINTANAQSGAGVQAAVDENGAGSVTLTAKGVLPKPPLFFKANAQTSVTVSEQSIAHAVTLHIDILQGKPELITLGIRGWGEVKSVTGSGLASWAVRTSADGKKRFLDLKPTLIKGKPAPKKLQLNVAIHQEVKVLPAKVTLTTIIPGKAAGFFNEIHIKSSGYDVRPHIATGLIASKKILSFFASGDHTLGIQVFPAGAARGKIELRGAKLSGSIDETTGSALLTYTATAHVREAGGVDFLSGRVALSSAQDAASYSLSLVKNGSKNSYRLDFPTAGEFPVNLQIVAQISDAHKGWEGWKTIDFTAPQGSVVPVELDGMVGHIEFAKNTSLLPLPHLGKWRGFLPANGQCFLAWKKNRKAGEGKLAFTSKGLTDVAVAAGTIRQVNDIQLKVLQGKITSLNLRMNGPGEVLDVSGTHIAAWKVIPGAGDVRTLQLTLSLPLENTAAIKVLSQQALEAFPVTATPLRLTPEGALRHSGYVRLTNAGAVRLETAGVRGMMQLSPEQFPGGAMKARQTFVYRYPSADYAWQVRADQILPEVSLNQVIIYQQSESDRVIRSTVELDIREAPLREWELRIPDGFAVADLQGAEIADYVVAPAAEKGMRDVKVLFKKSVIGRQLVTFRLEKNAPAKAGAWRIVPLEFPGIKALRGHVGIVAAAGWRVSAGKVSGLTETPLSYFPMKDPGLQQSFRLREQGWTAEMKVAAREQSVQADVFHLYSLKEGMAYGSVLLNYFVVGAPVNQWELSIPESFGNVTIEGQNVRQWRRAGGDKVIVELEQPVSGAAVLLVTFENAMSARGGKLSLGDVHPLNVQGESGFIEVVSPVQVSLDVEKTTPGLLPISAQELPAEFRLLATAPAKAAWQYAARPFELGVEIAWYDPGETLAQVVDFADLKSTVSRDGQVMTEATFYVRTRGRQALRMTLPEGAKLWEARANSHTITARRDGAQHLLPLPAGDDPNKPVKVTVRYGGDAASGSEVTLGAPALTAPLVIAGWKVSGGKGRLLVPAGGSVGVSDPPLTETGFESMQGRAGKLCLITVLMLAGVFFLRRKPRRVWLYIAAVLCLVMVAALSISQAIDIWEGRRVNERFINITAPVVAPDTPVNVVVENVSPWQAMVSWLGVVVAIVGGVALLASLVMKNFKPLGLNLLCGVGAALIAAGVLAQHGGGAFFYTMIAALALLLLILVIYRFIRDGSRWSRERWERITAEREEEEEVIALGSSPDQAEGVSRLLVIGAMIGAMVFAAPNNVQAAESTKVIDSLSQSWQIKENRLFATVSIKLQGKANESYPLLRDHAVLTSFQGDGLRSTKVKRNGADVWMLVAERDGPLTAMASYEMALPANQARFVLPTGLAAVQKITAEFDQPGLELFSASAVRKVKRGDSEELVLAPDAQIIIGIRARGRDVDSEETKFYVEVANLYLPSPGVVDGNHRITVRPSSGKVDQLELTVPAGFTVSEVIGKEVGNWRFDPTSRKLTVGVQPAQSRAFSFYVETQRGLTTLPASVKLSSLTVAADAGETNMIGLAFGSEAQPGKITTNNLSVVNVDDFDRVLIPSVVINKKPHPRGILHKVYRSTSGNGDLTLQVAPVKPEVRVVSRQELTLGSERILLSSILDASITRAGIFKLSFPVPAGMEVESVSGSSLSHWTESGEGKERLVTLHLTGRTLGAQRFSLTLSGPPSKASSAGWVVPKILLNEAIRQSGQLLVVPEKGIRIRAVDRKNVSTLQVKEVSTMKDKRSQQLNRESLRQKGGLAFRLLQSDWMLKLGIEKLDPWVTARVLHEVTLREGQTRTRLSSLYQIEHAAVKSLRVNLPGISEEEARTVRANGSSVQEIVKIDGEPGVWELRFRRGVLGSVYAQIEYQRGTDRGKGGSEEIKPATFPGTKRVHYFLSVRTTGRLDMTPGKLASGWRVSDWSAVPKNLRNPADTSVPDLCYRLNDPEGTLKVALKRHEMAKTLKLRVTGGEMMTIFSPAGDTLTSIHLKAPVEEKSNLRITLPKGAALYNVLVNDEPVHVVREGDAHMFHVSPPPVETEPADVILTYSTPATGGDIKLTAPGFNVPIEKLVWDVLVPAGYRLDGHSGGFEMRGSQGFKEYTHKDYLAALRSQRSVDAAKGVESLQKASDYMRQGKRKEAAKELSKVTKNRSVDAASNEDARVQLRQLQTQQALWGLNTRKQRIYLDNKAAGKTATGNSLLEDSAYNNPLFKGQQEFDVRKVDDFLRGNSAEEKKALKGIAKRIITQQLATEPAPQTISTIVQGRGEVLRFTRGITVDGSKTLALELDVKKSNKVSLGWIFIGLLGLSGAVAVGAKK